VWEIVLSFAEKDLVTFSPTPKSTDPHIRN
jgi:hypothetical protein